ncbi:putative LRR receptor-like serine/threonine-protein kinase [Heracleum sosnowskyi]|uniref:non-specific serine/threonine protein kinase n=1 Tax=Heracleum sosnowskyi TaxID=360622 RepID=A0AAD8IY00_9APIA|nr:putative LRR receptor-like serine/threonine-protein kinase [Heracleum sosnowskyi]
MESLHNIKERLNCIFVLLLSCSLSIGCDSQLLPAKEVQTLRMISLGLFNRYWTLSRSSCSNPEDFNVTFTSTILSNVRCDCSFENNSVCHVTHIQMKGLNLSGALPNEFATLTDLQVIDLSRNYISGSIPSAFGRLRVKFLSLLGNMIYGLIPPEIGNIITLEELEFEDNLLEGPLPENLGNLTGLRRLLLSGNNFNETIPETYSNLKNLTDFRIDGNELHGNIPDFIGNWTKIIRLDLQGTGMTGPIPLSISSMKNLKELRMSDLSGNGSTIPNLRDMKNMEQLVLRRCMLTGYIPEYISGFSKLKTLDLSFNRLSGQIPVSMALLNLSLKFLYLNNNLFDGEIPSWISISKENFDVSYNSFTKAAPFSCQRSNVNLVSSYSAALGHSASWCLKKDLPCPRKPQYHSLFINCGGSKAYWEGNEYGKDSIALGPSYFFSSSEKWAYSSTGVFMNNDKAEYIAANKYENGEEIYQTARLAPSSLKYYGLCLQRGTYRVRLHFAEIQYSDGQTFNSIGRRIFDVSVQGTVVRKNFDIAKEAIGVGKGIILDSNVTVDDGTLEIHLYWAGKGTTAVLDGGVYGPLISAITITPNFHVERGSSSTRTISVIVVGSLSGVSLLLLVLWRKGFLSGKCIEGTDNNIKENPALLFHDDEDLIIQNNQFGEDDQKDIDVPFFELETILAATDNFSQAYKLGQGGFGPVYKGKFAGGKEIAVKRLSSNSGQGLMEFKNEVVLIAKLQHRNLVRLLGYCMKANEKILLYEYMPNRSLDAFIFDEKLSMLLNWTTRFDIILGVARGLLYLHQDSRLRIIHRDMKASNILLDEEMNPKISDFGLARIVGGAETKSNTNRVMGTYGYMAPEYALEGLFSVKSDAFSFGVVVLEIISGKKNTGFYDSQLAMNLLGYAWALWKEEKPMALLDEKLVGSCSDSEVLKCIMVGLLCVQEDPNDRPSMSKVVYMLSSETETLPNPKQPAFVTRNRISGTTSSSTKPETQSENEITLSQVDGR